jgi:16S rRNA (adenine1518-N6/adenine1519-N6)-dimethyltransferase
MPAACPHLLSWGLPFPGQLRVIEEDALSIPLTDVLDDGGHIASNLPYNVGTALLVQWLSGEVWPPRWKSLTLMFQREVADRIVAQPGSSAYGRLSILGQWRSTARLAMPVHRSAFTPPPKVMSAVVHITPKPAPDGVSARVMEQITAAAFGQRRKMLRQSLKSLPGALDALEACGINGERRAETLSVDEFIALGRVLSSASAHQSG